MPQHFWYFLLIQIKTHITAQFTTKFKLSEHLPVNNEVPGPQHDLRRINEVPGPQHDLRRINEVPGPQHDLRRINEVPGPQHDLRRINEVPGDYIEGQ